MVASADRALYTARRVVAGVLGAVLFAGTALALALALYPAVTGGSSLAVLSGSMSPGLPVGTMVFIRPVEPADIEVGDVMTFQPRPDAPELVTHRVIGIDDSGPAPVFTTQGDANRTPDIDAVPASAVRGELWLGVPHLGRLAAVLHSPKGVGVLILLACAVAAASPGKRRPSNTDDLTDDVTPSAAAPDDEPKPAPLMTTQDAPLR